MRMYSFAGLSLRVAPIRICNMLTVICLMLLAVLSSCIHADDSRLISAYASVDRNPDSVRRVLESIDPSTLAGDRNKALHSLYLTIARDKCYMPYPNDSVISYAIRIFSKENDRYLLMLANFYRSVILYESGDNIGAIAPVMEAMELLDTTEDIYYNAKIHEHLSDIYLSSNNFEASNKELSIASSLYEKCGKRINSLYSKIAEAYGYALAKSPEKAIHILDSLDVYIDKNDSVLSHYYNYTYVLPENMMGRNETALEYFRKSLKFRNNTVFSSDYPILSMVFIGMGQMDSAKYYLNLMEYDKSAIRDKLAYFNVKAEIQKAEGNLAGALKCLDSASTIRNARIGKLLSQNEALAERDHFKMESQLFKERENRIQYVFISVAICVILLIITTVIFARSRILKHRVEAETAMRRIERLKSDLCKMSENEVNLKGKLVESENQLVASNDRIIDFEAQIDNIRKSYDQLKRSAEELAESYENELGSVRVNMEEMSELHKKTDIVQKESIKSCIAFLNTSLLPYFNSLQRVTNEYIQAENPKLKMEFMKRFNEEIDKFRESDLTTELCNILMQIHKDDIELFSSVLPKEKEKTKIFVACLLSGMSRESIEILLGINTKYFYVVKSRLKKKVMESNSTSKERFILLFDNKAEAVKE